jgi:hypothetical protein
MTAPPPPEIAHFVRAIGEEATLALLERFGGTRLYVAARSRGDSLLAGVIGLEAALALARLLGSDTIRVPLAKGWRARIYRARGMSYPAIAIKLGCNEVTAWKLANARREERQMALSLEGA